MHTKTATGAGPYAARAASRHVDKLHASGKIKFGKRHTIYSRKDGQACAVRGLSQCEIAGACRWRTGQAPEAGADFAWSGRLRITTGRPARASTRKSTP